MGLPHRNDRRYSTTDLRSTGSAIPGNGIRVPGTVRCGDVSQRSRVTAFQVRPDDFSAALYEYPDKLPARLPPTLARLGPKIVLPASLEWHPAHCAKPAGRAGTGSGLALAGNVVAPAARIAANATAIE